jgi:hypothetical protein
MLITIGADLPLIGCHESYVRVASTAGGRLLIAAMNGHSLSGSNWDT